MTKVDKKSTFGDFGEEKAKQRLLSIYRKSAGFMIQMQKRVLCILRQKAKWQTAYLISANAVSTQREEKIQRTQKCVQRSKLSRVLVVTRTTMNDCCHCRARHPR